MVQELPSDVWAVPLEVPGAFGKVIWINKGKIVSERQINEFEQP